MSLFSKKTKENASHKDDLLPITRKYSVLAGRIYIVEESQPVISFDAFLNIVSTPDKDSQRVSGLAISRQHPNLIREKYGLEDVRIYWLATRAGDDVISPTNLGILTHTIVKFAEDSKRGVILLDGLEYLVSNNDFNKVLRVVDQVSDHISQSKSVMIVPVDPRAFDPKELALLERNTEKMTAASKAK